MKKITRATVKKFVRENKEDLYLNIKATLKEIINGVESQKEGFKKALETDKHIFNSLGVDGLWLIGNGTDFFEEYEDKAFYGISIINSYGSKIIAIKK